MSDPIIVTDIVPTAIKVVIDDMEIVKVDVGERGLDGPPGAKGDKGDPGENVTFMVPAPLGTTTPAEYPSGISITQATVVNGFPFIGTLQTIKYSNPRIFQVLFPSTTTDKYFLYRHNLSQTGWDGWYDSRGPQGDPGPQGVKGDTGDDGVTYLSVLPTGASLPSFYPMGLSLANVAVTDSFPTGGLLQTVKSTIDARTYQTLYPKNTEPYFYYRHTLGAVGWSDWFTTVGPKGDKGDDRLYVGTTPPTDTSQVWVDTSSSPFKLNVYIGGQWQN